MVEKKDNILKGFSNWSYHFIVVRRLKGRKHFLDMNTFYIVDHPGDAYVIYTEMKRKNSNPTADALYEWILVDSFGKNALSFCKQKEEEALVLENDQKI